ncbi:transcriptional regulator, MarR family [Syntrophobotulus glycolicus DSM 8271]|uniref:Transcriptional regulator, MarR family n=1 Tax=Syntrophobotulus glycolicus (strain DSM 8271 / FlGlyR) TaxID=645991 RepID=F0SX96_SYNGF|nr:MarR family transcriptional regulator [Syntrophobotulus glycolicus]ADY56956.1 transcriptional regulator, MarR family [Syntrophobotulus glycolicus DSM 8271]
MSSVYGTLNEILVKLFNQIPNIEEKSLRCEKFKNLSITEIHIIEVIGIGEPRNMSSAAKDLDITIGTLTIAVNNLVRKGYVQRAKSEEDRRIVLLSLTEKGLAVYQRHADFHKDMINTTMNKLSEEEMNVLILALENINEYFREKYELTKIKNND